MLSFRDELKEERANLHRSKLVVIREICNEISPAQQWYVMYLGVSSSVETYYWLTDSLSGLEINLNLFPPRIETFPTGHGSHAVCLRTPAEETRGGEKGLASLNRPSVRPSASVLRPRPPVRSVLVVVSPHEVVFCLPTLLTESAAAARSGFFCRRDGTTNVM